MDNNNLKFKITNTTKVNRTAVLFGESKYSTAQNNGSDNDVQIELENQNISYQDFLNEMKEKCFDVGFIKLNSANFNQITLPLIRESWDANGQTVRTSINLIGYLPYNPINRDNEFFKENNMFVNYDIVDYHQDCNTSLTIEILPETEVYIEFRQSRIDSEMITDDYLEDFKHADIGIRHVVPYHFIIRNLLETSKKAVLFGSHEFINKKEGNYGSDEGIEIKTANPNMSYEKILTKSAFSCFETSLIVLRSENKRQLIEIITETKEVVSGDYMSNYIITQSYSNAEGVKRGVNQMPYAIQQDGNSKIEIMVLPKTRLEVLLYPVIINS